MPPGSIRNALMLIALQVTAGGASAARLKPPVTTYRNFESALTALSMAARESAVTAV